MKKPVIGVVPLWDEERNSIWMLPGYMDGVAAAGGIPIILPLDSGKEDLAAAFALCDGLLLTGGQDVAPALYGEEKRAQCGAACAMRDEADALFYAQALRDDKPVLGICRGIQFINAAHGGTLYQDLPSEYGSPIDHHMSPPYDRACHAVSIERQSPLYGVLRTERSGVNSYHHQAVKTVGEGLSVMATSEDGLTEAVCYPARKFVWAVQWHPELDFRINENSRRIFQAFLAAARG